MTGYFPSITGMFWAAQIVKQWRCLRKLALRVAKLATDK